MITEVRGLPWKRKRAKRIVHVRLLGDTYPEGHKMAGVPIAERFWHWSDIPLDRLTVQPPDSAFLRDDENTTDDGYF